MKCVDLIWKSYPTELMAFCVDVCTVKKLLTLTLVKSYGMCLFVLFCDSYEVIVA